MTIETKEVKIGFGLTVLIQKCVVCTSWFIKARKDKNTCSQACTIKNCQQNDRKLLKKAKKLS